ncbi:MAG: hypothetical protein IJK22_04000 [Bacteroidales bacterium]|nr:hypothetical protein [Bacteroidales bacterium]
MAWWPNGMEVRCPVAFARTGCRWATTTAHSTTPTLTNDRIIVNHRANGIRTAIPFGRKAQTLTRKCGQRRSRQAVAREGGHAKRNPKLARERAIGDPRFRHPIHLRDGDSVWPAIVRLLRQCDVIGKGKSFRYGVVAKRNGGAVSGSVCGCGLSLGDGLCTFGNPLP